MREASYMKGIKAETKKEKEKRRHRKQKKHKTINYSRFYDLYLQKDKRCYIHEIRTRVYKNDMVRDHKKKISL